MIDPKLNELPVTPLETGTAVQRDPEEEALAASRRRREGLSINDTIAGDAELSVGSRGVDVSGVRAGSGAAAGSSTLTPETVTSPAPELVGSARGTGENVAGVGHSGRSDTGLPGTGETDAFSSDYDGELTYSEISARAYECWCDRGCPNGSPDVDWDLAQQQLRAERSGKSRAASATA